MKQETLTEVIEFLIEELEQFAEIKGREGKRAQWVIDKAKSMLGVFKDKQKDRLEQAKFESEMQRFGHF